MSAWDTVARLLGLNAAQTPSPTSNVASPPTTPSARGAMAPPLAATVATADPFAPLWESVANHLSVFMAQRVTGHLRYEPDDIFQLELVRVEPQTAASEEVLDRFIKEFRPESRRKAIVELVRQVCPNGVSTEQLADFNRSFDAAALENNDPFLAVLNSSLSGGFTITLYGAWAPRPAQRSTAPGPTTPTSTGPALSIEIRDATGTRSVQAATYPLVFGRVPGANGQSIVGTFVSRRHCVVDCDEAGRPTYQDVSVNGTFIDGAQAQPGRHPLRSGARLHLGGEGQGTSFAEFPEIRITWDTAKDGDVTPIRVAPAPAATQAGATPTLAPASGTRALCLLAIKDASGSRTVAVARTPYRIGRANDADCRIPDQNLGVSREHLVIDGVTPQGAAIRNLGTWGTEVAGVEQEASFLLAFGQKMVLAHRYEHAPTITVELLKP